MTQRVDIGSSVRVMAPGSRTSDGEPRMIPAVVLGQWPDGSLQLYGLHFEGSPLLVNSISPDQVEMVFSRSEFDAICEGFNRRITELENQLSAATGWQPQVKDASKFALAVVDDAP